MINQITKYMLDVNRVPLPPPSEEKRIVAILDEAFDGITAAIENAERKLGCLAELKQSILQKAFAGHLATHPENVLPEVAE